MTTEELEEILRQDTDEFQDETDIDMLMYVAEVIRGRKEPNPNRKTPEEAFEIFKTHYMPTDSEMEEIQKHSDEKNIRKNHAKVIPMALWMRRMTAAAAVVVMIFASTMTANAFGINLWQVFVQWTEETFHFRGSSDQEPSAPEKENNQDYQSLQEALDRHKITVSLAPRWIPSDYELSDIKVNISPAQEVYLAIYLKDDQMLKVQIKRHLSEDPQQIEQSGTLVEEYESGGIVYFIFEDNEQLRTAWSVECFECYISGELTIDEMKQIVDSIKE
jgi:hypothetical protein